MTDATNTLAIELADLTPVELDNLVLSYPHRLPYTSQIYMDDLNRLAVALLEHESLGDALARCHRFATEES